jgi:hypothetical protein
MTPLELAISRLTRLRAGESARAIYAPEFLAPGATNAADANLNIRCQLPKDRLLTSDAYLDALPVIESIKQDIKVAIEQNRRITELHNQIVSEFRAQIALLSVEIAHKDLQIESLNRSVHSYQVQNGVADHDY